MTPATQEPPRAFFGIPFEVRAAAIKRLAAGVASDYDVELVGAVFHRSVKSVRLIAVRFNANWAKRSAKR